jgi:hypothetical protein
VTVGWADGTVKHGTGVLDVLFQTAFVKGPGFAFFGAHIPMGLPPMPPEVFFGTTTLSILKNSIEPHKGIWERTSPIQRQRDEDAHKESLASGMPKLFTRLKMADERERAAAEK